MSFMTILCQTKAMLDLVKDEFLTLLKKIIQDRKKFPPAMYKTKLLKDYVSNLSRINTCQNIKNQPYKKAELPYSGSSRSLNLLNTSFQNYIDNTQKSFAFSNRFNNLYDDYLNSLYKRGKYDENSLWLMKNSKNNKIMKRTKSSNNSFYISSSPFRNNFRRKGFDFDNSFSSKKSLNQSDIRNSSEEKGKAKVGSAYEDFNNRSFQIRRSNSKGISKDKYGFKENNIHVSLKNYPKNRKIIDYSSPGLENK